MYVSIANALATFLIHSHVAKEDDRQVYVFGFERIVSRIGTVLFLFIAGQILVAQLEAVIFFLGFLMIRKYGGGYHATTYVRCNATYLITFCTASQRRIC